MEHRVAFLDVFAERPLAGNGLAVVADADDLSDEAMLAFARETRLSETTYIQGATEDGADYRNRIWTPGEELPFAGHPSLGTAVAVARWRERDEASFAQQTGAGLQPIEVRREDDGPAGERWRATMLQEPAAFGDELDPDAAMRAVGLEPSDAHPELPPQLVSTGVEHCLAPLAAPEPLARARPDYPAIDALLGASGAVVLYIAWWDPRTGRGRARSFSRIVELGEDPATGSAIGPLCAYVAVRTGLDSLTLHQGEEMGRPSLLEARMEGDRVRVSGAVLPLIDGTVHLPGG
jgi:trans-2,3-dihydro-3-hydroxyanthranilate isomerase